MLGSGAWAVADQALFAGANFALNVLAARWLGDAGYGVFSVAYAIFLFISLAFTALVIDPLLIFGSGRWRGVFKPYLRRVLSGLLLLGLTTVVALLVMEQYSRFLDDSGGLEIAIRTLVWAGPAIVLQWTLRRSCYAIGKPHIAAIGGAIYFVLLLTLAVLANRTRGLDAQTMLVVMAVASLITAAHLWWRLSRTVRQASSSPEEPAFGVVMRTHWSFGRWILAGYLLDWVGNDVLYLVLAPAHGPESVGTIRASMNLVMPVLHALVALSSVAVPWFVSRRNSPTFIRDVKVFWLVNSVLSAAYCAALIAFAEPLINMVYGQVFDGIESVVHTIAFIPLAVATQASLGTVLRSTERTRSLFFASAVTASVTATLGIWLTITHAAQGTAAALLIGAAVNAISLIVIVGSVPRSMLGAGSSSSGPSVKP